MKIKARITSDVFAIGVIKAHVDLKYYRSHFLTFYLPFFYLHFIWVKQL